MKMQQISFHFASHHTVVISVVIVVFFGVYWGEVVANNIFQLNQLQNNHGCNNK